MNKIKSLVFTILISGLVFGGLYFIPIDKAKKEPLQVTNSVKEEGAVEVLDSISGQDSIDLTPILEENIAETLPEQKPLQEETKVTEASKVEKQEVIAKKEEPKSAEKPAESKKPETKKENQKEDIAKKEPQKESKIGVDRKLISGIPGTLNYKGKFPPHSVKEKGNITISYEVDKNGNVISARRIDGLRDRNTINNAITLVKKYVKAEKSKNNSTGTYTIKF